MNCIRLQIDCLSVKVKKDLVTLIFKIINSLLPDILSFKLNLKALQYNLRNRTCIIQLPKPNTNFCKTSTIYIASQLFKNLPQQIKTLPRLSQFVKDFGAIFDPEF